MLPHHVPGVHLLLHAERRGTSSAGRGADHARVRRRAGDELDAADLSVPVRDLSAARCDHRPRKLSGNVAQMITSAGKQFDLAVKAPISQAWPGRPARPED